MASDKYDYCLLELKSSFEEARLKEDEWLRVDLVEVWGCGGMQATETQQRIKQWEARQALRHREVFFIRQCSKSLYGGSEVLF